MARPVHFELPVDDPERAQVFYESVFGWDINGWGDFPYWLVTSGPDSEPGINGALTTRSDNFPMPVLVIGVDDIDAAIAAAADAGASIVGAKNPIPGIGYSVYLDDPEGNRIGLFQSDETVAGNQADG